MDHLPSFVRLPAAGARSLEPQPARTSVGPSICGFPCWGEERSSTASRSFLKPRLGVTRTSGQSLPNSERRNSSHSIFGRPARSLLERSLLGIVWLVLAVCPARGDQLQLGGLRVFNHGRDLRLFVQRPESNVIYELQITPSLGSGANWSRAQL